MSGQQPVIIRTSDRGMFKSCRQKWDFTSKMRMNYEPKFAPQPLEFGSAIHAGLETYYNPLTWEQDRRLVRNAMLGAFIKYAEDARKAYNAAVEEGLDPEKARDFDAEIQLGLGMLDHYADWAPEQDHWFKPVKVEIEFEVPVPDPEGPNGQLYVYYWDPEQQESFYVPVVYQGRIDVLVEDKQGRYWVLDHKTMAQAGSTDWYDMDEQGGSYCWALSQMLGLPIAGTIYNQLLKDVPTPPEPLKTVREGRRFSVNKQMRCTAELYEKTLLEHNEPFALYLDHIQYLRDRGNPFFRRVEIHRTPGELQYQGEMIRLETKDMTNPALSIYPNPGPAWNQCSGCSFKAPCLARRDSSDVQLILDTNYRKRA